MNPCNFHTAHFALPPDAHHVDDQSVVASTHDDSQGPLGTTVVVAMDAIRDRTRREANRTNCRVARERMRERERQLREEVEILTLCRDIVNNGPDLFSMHRVDLDASFSFVSGTYYERLLLTPEDLLGRSLVSIVDPRDAYAVSNALSQVLTHRGGDAAGSSGTLVNVRVVCHGLSYEAGMTIKFGSEGLVVVTRLY